MKACAAKCPAQTTEAVLGRMPGGKRVAGRFGTPMMQSDCDADMANEAGIISTVERASFRAQALAR